MKAHLCKVFFILLFTAFILSCKLVGAQLDNADVPAGKSLKYSKILEKYLEGEEVTKYIAKILVRAYDLKNNGKKNGIVVANKKLYILSNRGTILFSTPEAIFAEHDVQQIRVSKLLKDGFYDNIMVAYYTCSPEFFIFDRLGTLISTIKLESEYQNEIQLYAKDINYDEIDEMLVSNRSYYTQDGGYTWKMFYNNDELNVASASGKNARIYGEPNFETNICVRYENEIACLDRNGKIIFRSKIPPPQADFYWLAADFPYVPCDFDGSGIKNYIAAVGDIDETMVFILDKNGNIIKDIALQITPEQKKLSANIMRAGPMADNTIKDSIIVGGSYYLDETGKQRGHGIIAYDSDGNKIWEYLTDNTVSHIFINDLDSDGIPEVILGTGLDYYVTRDNCRKNKIIILSNNGKLKQELIVRGELLGIGWGSFNPAMDIADINDDGNPEILAVTSCGNLYIFARKTK